MDEDVAIIGFFMIADLTILWRHFSKCAPSSEVLLYKVFDLYLFLRFTHNGHEDKNSLADWTKRLVNLVLDKTFQKCKWFQTELSPQIQNYLKNDVFVLHKLLDFVKNISHLYYYNTWTDQKHFYFETSSQFLF